MYELPSVYQSFRYTARKYGKMYKLYYGSTLNEVFPGELFRSPKEAKDYCHAMIIKNNEKKG